jgi:hypothetical protein
MDPSRENTAYESTYVRLGRVAPYTQGLYMAASRANPSAALGLVGEGFTACCGRCSPDVTATVLLRGV